MTQTLTRRDVVGRIAAATGVVLVVSGASRAGDEQPHMRAALAALRKAQEELAAATADKGGHRVAAEKFVREAIGEVEAGIGFDNRHP